MKKFIQYFVLEFLIIFLVGYAADLALSVSPDINQLLIVSLVAGGIISAAMVTFQKRN